mmetsp:Transcript_103344/g.297592  ORF Transcript_103344/g.297592 Transcript_103344/m.297592 type:complete len:202 (-) Transcript_103344:130-735(-)
MASRPLAGRRGPAALPRPAGSEVAPAGPPPSPCPWFGPSAASVGVASTTTAAQTVSSTLAALGASLSAKRCCRRSCPPFDDRGDFAGDASAAGAANNVGRLSTPFSGAGAAASAAGFRCSCFFAAVRLAAAFARIVVEPTKIEAKVMVIAGNTHSRSSWHQMRLRRPLEFRHGSCAVSVLAMAAGFHANGASHMPVTSRAG